MVAELLDAGAVGADVVRAPAPAEVVAAGRQLADQVKKVVEEEFPELAPIPITTTPSAPRSSGATPKPTCVSVRR